MDWTNKDLKRELYIEKQKTVPDKFIDLYNYDCPPKDHES